MLGVSIKTIRRWSNTGKIKYVRTAGGHRRFPIDEIKRFIGCDDVIDDIRSEHRKDRKERCAI
ncbi:MAG: MerR family transcriptional regulator [Promethearchaeota archaeon]